MTMKNKARRRISVSAVVCLVGLAAGFRLSGQKDKPVEVKNPKQPMHQGEILNLVEELRIGESSGRPESSFGQVSGIAVDGQGRIYVADEQNMNVKVFDSRGDWERTVGRPGQGPGEIGRAYDVFVNSRGEIAVPDGQSRKLHLFSSAGTFLRSLSFGTRFPMESVPGPDDGYYVLSIGRSDEGSRFELASIDASLKPVAVLMHLDVPRGPLRMSLDENIPLFTSRPDGGIVLGYPKTDEYRLESRDRRGRATEIITREFEPVRIPQSLLEKARSSQSAGIDVKLPTHFPAFSRIMTDAEGFIFALTPPYELENTTFTWDVFDRGGRYLAVVRLPGSITLIMNHKNCYQWRGGKLYAVVEDEDGYHTVKRFRAEWKIRR
jgi:hypothetical protein